MHDFAAKIVCDNLQALASQAAHELAALPATRRINRAYAHSVLKPLFPALQLGSAVAAALWQDPVSLIARKTCREDRNHGPDNPSHTRL